MQLPGFRYIALVFPGNIYVFRAFAQSPRNGFLEGFFPQASPFYTVAHDFFSTIMIAA
jgi:hypothetical protein